MANLDPIYPGTPINPAVQFTISDTTAKKTLYTVGSNGALLSSIVATTNDTTAVNLQFYIGDGTTDHYIGVVNVPIGSGYTTVAKVDCLLALLPSYVRALLLQGTYTLKVACLATMTTGKVLDLYATGGSY